MKIDSNFISNLKSVLFSSIKSYNSKYLAGILKKW
jgi:hypothetical protein